jgi:hypothetical protein
VTAAGWSLLSIASTSFAAPLNGAAIPRMAPSAPAVEEARLFCYNRYSGRFLHWGPCGGGYGYGYHRPRYYCRNRWGQFLHWGPCY